MPSATESKPGYGGIPVEHGPERLLQRVEPRLVVPPLVHALAKDRPAHLLGAGSANRPLVLVETKHALLERQAAVVEQAAHLTLGVLDHVLVEHTMHPPRQNGIEVGHEFDVVAVVATEFSQVIGEILAAREVLLEAGEAAAEWMPPSIDDLRLGQHQ